MHILFAFSILLELLSDVEMDGLLDVISIKVSGAWPMMIIQA